MSEADLCPRCGAQLENGSGSTCPRCSEDVTLDNPASIPEAPTINSGSSGDALRAPPRFFGDYELLDEIARGGMGVVYRARQKSLNRVVALKMILAGQLAGDADVERFRTEAESAANLRHPNIVAIHEVGALDGQHYFSMDYIAGRSLSDEVRQGPLPVKQAAELAVIIARAIHYAHDRGILHRDLKPSNVLLDEHGQPQVTDFGLAKHMGSTSDVTATGQVLGTPSYMPPEQASGRHNAVGPASDVYSIGAIFYETLVGRPPFQAETALDTILQVIDHEPPPPRLLNPKLSRDVDTIVLKCLEKEPLNRYATAEALAEDIDRYLADEPIRARRIGWVEQWVRRSRTHARSIRAASFAVTGVVMLVLGVFIARNLYLQSRMASVHFQSVGRTLRAELFTENSDKLLTSFSIPTVDPLRVAEGEYQLRLSAPGQFQVTSRLTIERGIDHRFRVGLGHDQLWRPIPFDVFEHYHTVRLRHYDDIILLERRFDMTTLRRIDGLTGRQHWSVPISRTPPAGISLEAEVAVWQAIDWGGAHDLDKPLLMTPAPDLNGDETNDLVWMWPFADESPMLAQSGEDGSVLWYRCHGPSALDAMPYATDLNGDGQPELAVVLRNADRLQLEVVDGQTAERVWQSDLPTGTADSTKIRMVAGRQVAVFASGSRLINVGGQSKLAVTTGNQLTVFDPETQSVDRTLAFDAPLRAVQFLDPDSTGTHHALVVTKAPTAKGMLRLSCFALNTGQTSWLAPFGNSGLQAVDGEPFVNWPFVIDLDDDGRLEIVLPNDTNLVNRPLTIAVLDATTGKRRWGTDQKLSLRGPAFAKQVLGLPDVNGDGERDLVVVSVSQRSSRTPRLAIFVDTLSGQDGAKLSTWHRPFSDYPVSGQLKLTKTALWEPDRQHVPTLVLAVSGQSRTAVDIISLTEARIVHSVADLTRVQLTDLNGDGMSDLLMGRSNSEGGRLSAIAGGPPPMWNRVGSHKTLSDFDGDGYEELTDARLSVDRSNIPIYSGRTGALFDRWSLSWPKNSALGFAQLVPLAMPDGDLDGDRVADVMAWMFRGDVSTGESPIIMPLQIISGRTGKRIWNAESLPSAPLDKSLGSFGTGFPDARLHDLDGDGRPEMIVPHRVQWLQATPPRMQLRLAVYDSRQGKLKWDGPLCRPAAMDANFGGYSLPFRLASKYVDLNHDGVLDIVATHATGIVGNRRTSAVHAINGADGSTLWSYPLAMTSDPADVGNLPAAALVDLDGDGQLEIAISDESAQLSHASLDILAADTGTRLAQTSFERAGENLPGEVLVARRGGPGALIVVPSASELASFVYSNGKVVEATRFKATVFQKYLITDSDGDGVDELVFTYKSKLISRQGDEVRWERALPTGDCQIAGQRTATGELFLYGSVRGTVVGVDPRNGEIVSRGQALPSSNTRISDPAAANQLPRVFSSIPTQSNQSPQYTTVSSTLATDPRGRYEQGGLGQPAQFVTVVDPRLVVTLPWVPSEQDVAHPVDFDAFRPLVTAASMGTLIYVIPAWWVCGAVVRRQWSLRRWLLLPVVVGVALGAVQSFAAHPLVVRESSGGSSFPWAFGFAAIGATTMLFPIELGILLWKRRLRAAVALVALSFIAAVVWGVWWMQLASASFAPEQSFRYDGWYLIWFSGAYAAAWLGLVIATSRWIVRRLRPRREET